MYKISIQLNFREDKRKYGKIQPKLDIKDVKRKKECEVNARKIRNGTIPLR